MKRLAAVVLVTAFAATGLALWGGAASAGDATQAQKLPGLPANIKSRGRFKPCAKWSGFRLRSLSL